MNVVVSVVSVSAVCDQVDPGDQVVPAHQVNDIDEVHELDPVHQVYHESERTFTHRSHSRNSDGNIPKEYTLKRKR